MAVVAVIMRWGKRCCICGEDVGASGAVEVIVVMRLKWLGMVVEFVVKRLGTGCCEHFWKVFVVIMVSIVASW